MYEVGRRLVLIGEGQGLGRSRNGRKNSLLGWRCRVEHADHRVYRSRPWRAGLVLQWRFQMRPLSRPVVNISGVATGLRFRRAALAVGRRGELVFGKIQNGKGRCKMLFIVSWSKGVVCEARHSHHFVSKIECVGG